MIKQIYNALPIDVRRILILGNGWLIGSAPENIILKKPVKDYDIIVPLGSDLQAISLYLQASGFAHTFNTFGGLKFSKEDIVVDVWVESLDHLIFSASYLNHAVNLKHYKIITLE